MDFLFFCPPFKEAVTQASELKESCNTLKVIRDGTESGRRQWISGQGASWVSGVGGVDGGFVACGHAPVPAAVAFLLLDAGVVPGLVARIAEVGQHVRP